MTKTILSTAVLVSFAKTVKNLFKGPSVITDDFVFRLHYKLTFWALLFASILIFCYQFFRNSLSCNTRDDISEGLINEFCKLSGTYTLPGSFSKKVGVEVPHPGVDKYSPGQDVMTHHYYQFVCYVLLLQALLFRLPHIIWRNSESGRMEDLVDKLKNPMLEREETLPSCLVTEFNDRQNEHQCYAMKFFLCEVLNIVIVICQMFFVNKFLGGQFLNFGVDVIRYDNDGQDYLVDPRIRIFPRVTKCTFHRYGRSGDVQRYDAICLMRLNVLHDNIFLIMWFWFVILIVMGGCVLIYRMIVLCSRQARLRLLNCVSSFSSRSIIKFLVPTLSYGEWFSLYLLANNIDNIYFRHFIQQLKESRSDTSTSDFYTVSAPNLIERSNRKPMVANTLESDSQYGLILEDMCAKL